MVDLKVGKNRNHLINSYNFFQIQKMIERIFYLQ